MYSLPGIKMYKTNLRVRIPREYDGFRPPEEGDIEYDNYDFDLFFRRQPSKWQIISAYLNLVVSQTPPEQECWNIIVEFLREVNIKEDEWKELLDDTKTGFGRPYMNNKVYFSYNEEEIIQN